MTHNTYYLIVSLACISVGPLFAQERGQPWKRHAIDSTSRGADGVRFADVNGDGLLDVAVGWEEGRMVRAYLHPGKDKVKQPWPAVTVGEVASAEDAVFVDLDADGAVDVVSCCEGKTKTVFVHWAPKERDRYLDPDAWKTEAIPILEGKQLWMFCLPMQVDGKHGVDLVLASKGQGGSVGWLEAPANPRDLSAWKWHPLYKAGWIMSLIEADIDGDGDNDILVSDRKGAKRGCLWLEHPGADKASGPWKEHRIGGTDKEVMFLSYADLDMDKRSDVLVAIKPNVLLCLRRLPGEAVQWEEHTIPYPENMGTGKSLNVGDINLDDRPDLVLTCENSKNASGVVWIQPHQSPKGLRWQTHEISGPKGVKFDLTELIDIDGDGDLDVVTTEERDRLGVIWYENPTR